MTRGLRHFAEYFAGDEANYVLIGGVPTVLILEDNALVARGTKDLDVVLCIEALTPDFGRKLWTYIELTPQQLKNLSVQGITPADLIARIRQAYGLN